MKFCILKITTFKELPNNTNTSNIFKYINERSEYEGVYFAASIGNKSEVEKKLHSNEIDIHIASVSKSVYLTLSDNNKITGSIERVKLITRVATYLNVSAKNLKIVSINYDDSDEINENYKKQTLIVTFTNIDDSLQCDNFFESIKSIFNASINKSIEFEKYLLLNHRILKIDTKNNCEALNASKVSVFDFSPNYARTLLENLDGSRDDFLIVVIIPSVIIGGMLILSILLACILHYSNKKYKRNSEQRDKNPIYKQKSYLSKGVPVILYEEMTEKNIEEEDTLRGGHRAPLIMRNEKPPQAAPPEYRKQHSLQHLNDEQTINDIKNMLNNAPLASTEAVNDDTIPFIAINNENNISTRDDLAFYQPPQPIAAIRDVSRRSHTNTNQSQTTQLLP